MSSISESYKLNPINLNHIIPHDFEGVLRLPDSHTWTLSGDNPVADPTQFSVPVINLDDPDSIMLTRQACENWGVFQITNHGIPVTLLEQVELQARRLFTLPRKQKLRTLRSPDSLTGYGLARLSSFFSKMMWSEGFTIMGSPVEHARQLWPDDHTDFCNVVEEYQKEMERLSNKMTVLMLSSLGLTLEEVEWVKPKNGSKPPQVVLQMNSYPICPDPNRAMGLAAHTDSSLITLLYQSNISGLQVLKENIGWVTVQPIKDAIVVNVGDLMHILSNGNFKSTLHRARVNKTRHRISLGYFYGPPGDVKISPSVKLTDPYHPPLYRQVTWKEFLDAKATHFNKALDFMGLDQGRS